MAHPLMVRAWRKATDNSGLVVSLSEAEQAVLRHLRSTSSCTVEQLMVAAGLSRRTAEDIIVRLATLDVVQFVHRRNGFEVCVKPE